MVLILYHGTCLKQSNVKLIRYVKAGRVETLQDTYERITQIHPLNIEAKCIGCSVICYYVT